MTKPGAVTSQPIVISHGIFRDIDEFDSANRDSIDEDIKLTQLSLGRLHCEFFTVDFGEARISFTTSNHSFRGIGAKGDHFIDFACVLEPHQPGYLIHDYRVSPNTLAGMATNVEVNFVLPSDQICFFAQFEKAWS